ncbi:MAG: HAD hydrolase-like protein, partial [Spirochaetales bacterium]|nr:HAD hydrolase-like protein [Spirochaetales bacterium]
MNKQPPKVVALALIKAEKGIRSNMEGSVQFQNGDRCIIFDMDGVLVNSEPLHFEFEEKFFESLGITVSREEHETFVGTTNRTMWVRLSRSQNLPMTIPELL